MADQANIIVKLMLSERKRKGVYLFAILTLIVTIALFFLAVYLYGQHLPGRRLTVLFFFIGVLLFLFAIWAIYNIRKEGYLGVIVSDEGITDLSTGYQIGTVLWKDVDKIKIMDDLENLDYRYIVLVVKNPNQYIMQEPTAIKRRSLMLKLHQYGSPVCISIRALDCSFEELYTTVVTRYQKVCGENAVVIAD